MSQSHVLVKVYGHVWPADTALERALEPLAGEAVPAPEEIPVLEREGDLLRLSFEGMYFPVDEVVETLRQHLTPASHGKVDYLDMEAWILTRHSILDGKIHSNTVPLNHVLDYSGH